MKELPKFAICNICTDSPAFLIDAPSQEGTGLCPNCHGSNVSPLMQPPLCRTCNGNGVLVVEETDTGRQRRSLSWVSCPSCRGSSHGLPT